MIGAQMHASALFPAGAPTTDHEPLPVCVCVRAVHGARGGCTIVFGSTLGRGALMPWHGMAWHPPALHCNATRVSITPYQHSHAYVHALHHATATRAARAALGPLEAGARKAVLRASPAGRRGACACIAAPRSGDHRPVTLRAVQV